MFCFPLCLFFSLVCASLFWQAWRRNKKREEKKITQQNRRSKGEKWHGKQKDTSHIIDLQNKLKICHKHKPKKICYFFSFTCLIAH